MCVAIICQHSIKSRLYASPNLKTGFSKFSLLYSLKGHKLIMILCSLSLAVPPAFTTDGQLTSKLGFARENLTLRCNATGAPLPGYEWRKEETPLNANNADFAFPSPGILVFNSLNSALQGNYTCIAKSMIDTDTVIGIVNSTAQVFVAGNEERERERERGKERGPFFYFTLHCLYVQEKFSFVLGILVLYYSTSPSLPVS